MRSLKIILIAAIFMVSMCPMAQSAQSAETVWGPFRGANVLSRVDENDVADFARYGGNLLRVSFNDDPLMEKVKPYSFNERAFSKLDKILDWCEFYGIKVVIDPHTFPGTNKNTTTEAGDVLWKDEEIQNWVVYLWAKIAKRYAQRGDVIAGYDLVNEPSGPPGFKNDNLSWNQLAYRLIKEIRRHDQTHYIIVGSVAGFDSNGRWLSRFDSLSLLNLFEFDKIVYSPHMYAPIQFTHQGVGENALGVDYPGKIGRKYWDKNALRETMLSAVAFSKQHSVPIFVGEFSASRYAGAESDKYIADLIDIFESFGWSWAYHAFRSADVWDPEIAGTNPTQRERTDKAPRIQLLRAAFKRNKQIGGP